MVLTDFDNLCLFELDRKAGIVRDRVRDVATRRFRAFGLFGPSGTGKSKLVRDTLGGIGIAYQELTGHSTPMGLFDTLKRFPDGDILLDDNLNLLADKSGQEMLLAAGDGGTDGVRVIRYTRR